MLAVCYSHVLLYTVVKFGYKLALDGTSIVFYYTFMKNNQIWFAEQHLKNYNTPLYG
jgi:hypothetical protein